MTRAQSIICGAPRWAASAAYWPGAVVPGACVPVPADVPAPGAEDVPSLGDAD